MGFLIIYNNKTNKANMKYFFICFICVPILYLVVKLYNKLVIFYKIKNYVFKYEHHKKFIDYTYYPVYDKKREPLQEKIIDDHFSNKQKQIKKKVIFTGGCYGAGKSNTIKQLHKLGKINLKNHVYVDQDKMRDQIPEYKEYLKENHFTAGYKTNKETGYLSEIIQRHSLFNGYSLIIDSSLKDGEWHKMYIDWIKTTFPDYEIIIIFVTASWVKILERNLKRGEITKRVIPLDCLADAFEKSPISFEMLKSQVDRYYVIQNDSDSNTLNQFNDIDFIDK